MRTLSWHDGETVYQDGKFHAISSYYSTGADETIFNREASAATAGFNEAANADPTIEVEQFLTASA